MAGILFVLDIFFKGLSSDEASGMSYLLSYVFILDFLSVIPYILQYLPHQNEALQTMILLKLGSAEFPVRKSKIKNLLLQKLATLVYYLILYTHCTACFIYYLVKTDRVWLPSQYDFFSVQEDFYS